MENPPRISLSLLERQLAEFELLDQNVIAAINIAIVAHGLQKRDQGTAYLDEHILPIASSIAARYRFYPERCKRLLVLAILHDVVEDYKPDPENKLEQAYTFEKLEEYFGQEIAADLKVLTKSPKPQGVKLNQEEKYIRNKEYLENIFIASADVMIVKIEDRINNLNSIVDPNDEEGKYRRYVMETRELFLPLARNLKAIDPIAVDYEEGLSLLLAYYDQLLDSETAA